MGLPNILLVDDEDGFRTVLAKRLSKRGFAVRQAANGEAGLDEMARDPADVVVLDVKMPGMDGLQVLKILRDKYPENEILLLTGHASASDGVQGIKTGAFDYLSKPVEIEHLAGKIRQAWSAMEVRRKEREEKEFHKKLEARLTSAQRLAALGTLAAGVAHEINNPLAIINDSAGWLLQIMDKELEADSPAYKKMSKGLTIIEKSVDRARRITHQLLSIARPPEERLDMVDLRSMASDAMEMVNKGASNKDVELVLEPGEVSVLSEPNQLRQVFINLITNALQATPKGGRVSVRLAEDDREVSFTVSDTGPGIAEKDREHIFEPFYSTKPEGKGTGLGLYITGSIVRKLGGFIEVGGDEGRGAAFTVTLPKEPPRPEDQDQDQDWQKGVKKYVDQS